MRVDDRELAVRRAAEQVAGTGAGVVQERSQQHRGLLSARDLDRQARAPPLREADVQPARLQARAREAAGPRRRHRRSRGRGSRRRSRAAAAARPRAPASSSSGAERAPAMCPARYSGSGRTSSTTTSPRASRSLELRRRELLDPVALAEVLVGEHAHLGDVPGGDVAHRRPQLGDAIARQPVDDPRCPRGASAPDPPAPAPADAARCWRRSARSRRDLLDRALALREHVDDLRPPAAAERLRHRRERVEQRRLRRPARHIIKLSLEYL